MLKNGFATKELFDQRRQALDAANAESESRNGAGCSNRARARSVRARCRTLLGQHRDNALVAPRDGRIQYRVANVGEVLPAGGKVFTMLDISYVYMDIYLPTPEAGQVKVGSDARIVLDAYPNAPIPAKVAFLASQAQFTPKTVETKDERDKLMFRIRVRIDPERPRDHAQSVRSGLPGLPMCAPIRTVVWPQKLQGAP